MTLGGKQLFLRVDANTQMGTGHLMRCLALAQGWQEQGGQATFVTTCDSEVLLHRLWEEGFQIIILEEEYPDPREWETTKQVFATHPESWVVLDGYHFDPAYHRKIKKAGHRLLVIDDMAHLDHYVADLVLNQNIHAAQLNYVCEPDTRLLLGTEYVLLRREFWSWRKWKRDIPEVGRKVLVTLGGSDPDNQTLKIIHAIKGVGVDDIEVLVVVGASNPHYDKLQIVTSYSKCKIRLVQNATNMPELMGWADVALAAGGSTCWEAAFLGLPSILLTIADNQCGIAKELNEAGVVINLGWYEDVLIKHITKALSHLFIDIEQRRRMSYNGQYLVDGNGCERVVSTMS